MITEKIKNWLLPLITVAAALNALYSAHLDNQIKTGNFKIDSLNTSLETTSMQLDNYIKQAQFDRDLKFKLFTEIKDALVSKNAAQQKVLLDFIDEVLANDTSLRYKYRSMLVSNGAPEVKVEVNQKQKIENLFYKEDVEKLAKPAMVVKPGAGGAISKDMSNDLLKVDVFYLEQTAVESKPIAEKVQAALTSTGKYTVRLRMLPRSINAQSGYMISANQIRVEEHEMPQGEEVRGIIQKVFPLEKPRIQRVSNNTPGYISVFVSNL